VTRRSNGSTESRAPILARQCSTSRIVARSAPALVLRGQIGERGEELLLVCGSDGVPAVASQPERHRLEETIGGEGLEDGVDVARRFRFTVSFEEAEHLVAVDRVLLPLQGLARRRRTERNAVSVMPHTV
jgi:hypothetical protein